MVGQLTESVLNFLFTKTATIWRPFANDNEVDAHNSTGYRGNFACIKSLCRGNKILTLDYVEKLTKDDAAPSESPTLSSNEASNDRSYFHIFV